MLLDAGSFVRAKADSKGTQREFRGFVYTNKQRKAPKAWPINVMSYMVEPMMQADLFGPPYLLQWLNLLKSGNRSIGVLPCSENLVSNCSYGISLPRMVDQ